MIPNVSGIWTAIAPAVANHLWQSTLFAAAVGALALAMRKNQARDRYWLWLAASVKFLIPFSLLAMLGGYFAKTSAAVGSAGGLYATAGEVATVSDFLTVGLSPVQRAAVNANAVDRGYHLIHALPAVLIAIWLCGFMAVLLVWFARWRRMRQVCRIAVPVRQGRELEALHRLTRRAGIRKPIGMLLSRASLEPGIFGIFHPVLIWPEGISARLEDAHLESILAHEALHVRRRDNLMAAIHMAVEAIFWFHPLVWWMGARLVDERERACDEAIIALSMERRVYAESILKACEFSVESPLACVSGVTGGDLKKRIVRIMSDRATLKLSARKKLLLAAAGFLAVALPIGFGLAHGRPRQADLPQGAGLSEAGDSTAARPKFEVASIKPDRSGDDKMNLFMSRSGRFSASAVSAKTLIELAYHLQSDGQIVGAPSWVKTKRFDIEAKEDDASVQKMRKMSFDEGGRQIRLMVQSMLADRFKLRVSPETKELPIYALVIAKNGPKLTPTKLPPPGQIGANHPAPPGHGGAVGEGVRVRPGQITCMGVATSFLAEVLSRQPEVGGRIVIDETGLEGRYDGTLKWTPEFGGRPMGAGPGPGGADASAGPEPVIDSSGPSLFTALEQQLGLKLKPTKGPVEVLVIDHIEPPTPN